MQYSDAIPSMSGCSASCHARTCKICRGCCKCPRRQAKHRAAQHSARTTFAAPSSCVPHQQCGSHRRVLPLLLERPPLFLLPELPPPWPVCCRARLTTGTSRRRCGASSTTGASTSGSLLRMGAAVAATAWVRACSGPHNSTPRTASLHRAPAGASRLQACGGLGCHEHGA